MFCKGHVEGYNSRICFWGVEQNQEARFRLQPSVITVSEVEENVIKLKITWNWNVVGGSSDIAVSSWLGAQLQAMITMSEVEKLD